MSFLHLGIEIMCSISPTIQSAHFSILSGPLVTVLVSTNSPPIFLIESAISFLLNSIPRIFLINLSGTL